MVALTSSWRVDSPTWRNHYRTNGILPRGLRMVLPHYPRAVVLPVAFPRIRAHAVCLSGPFPLSRRLRIILSRPPLPEVPLLRTHAPHGGIWKGGGERAACRLSEVLRALREEHRRPVGASQQAVGRAVDGSLDRSRRGSLAASVAASLRTSLGSSLSTPVRSSAAPACAPTQTPTVRPTPGSFTEPSEGPTISLLVAHRLFLPPRITWTTQIFSTGTIPPGPAKHGSRRNTYVCCRWKTSAGTPIAHRCRHTPSFCRTRCTALGGTCRRPLRPVPKITEPQFRLGFVGIHRRKNPIDGIIRTVVRDAIRETSNAGDHGRRVRNVGIGFTGRWKLLTFFVLSQF
mmetsp:Transcript_10259/g.22769  ORF Transcript_10259/g.22769 Transcript_10259/m.22769 type:complete len:344 (-) Transcript_10259:6-1037(-)